MEKQTEIYCDYCGKAKPKDLKIEGKVYVCKECSDFIKTTDSDLRQEG